MIFQPTESVGIDMSGQGDTSEVRVQMRAFRDLSRGAFCFLGFGRASFQGFGCCAGLRNIGLSVRLRRKLVMQALNQTVAIRQQPACKGCVLLMVDDNFQSGWFHQYFGNGLALG